MSGLPSVLQQRARFTASIRRFFDSRNYTEVDTPCMATAVLPESHIDYFQTQKTSPDDTKSIPAWLLPSPEYWMKKLLAKSSGNIYQIAHSFRNAEPSDNLHLAEFSMLEWYTLNADYDNSIELTEALFNTILPPDSPAYMFPPFKQISVNELVLEHTGASLHDLQKIDAMRDFLREREIHCDESDDWNDMFQRLFITTIEPNIPRDTTIVVKNYPSKVRTLADDVENTPWAQRWELYTGGVEVINCYSEETNRLKIKQFFDSENRLLSIKGKHVAPDTEFAQQFSSMDVPCTGAALGVDRLFMLAHRLDHIDIYNSLQPE